MLRVIRSSELPPYHGLYAWSCAIAGKVLEGRSRHPLLDACFAIKRSGLPTVSQQIGLYRDGREKPDLICDLEWGAGHTVSETRERGPRFVKRREYER